MPSVRRVNWAKFRAFAVCLVALVILGTLIYLLSGGTLFEPKVSIYMFIPDATGLDKDAPVRVDGIDVGKVVQVALSGINDPHRVVRVTIKVPHDHLAMISSDASAQLGSDSLIGDKYVDIQSGTSTTSIRPGGELPYQESTMMKSLDLSQFKAQLQQVDTVLTGIEQGNSRVGQFVQGDDMYRGILKQLVDIRGDIAAMASTTTPVGKVMYTDELYRQISGPLVQLDQTLARLQSGQGSAGQLLKDSGQYTGLTTAVRDLRQSISQTRAEDFMKSDSMYRAWNQQLLTLIRMVDGWNSLPMLTTTEAYDNLNGTAKELRDTVKDFRVDPRKYLRTKMF